MWINTASTENQLIPLNNWIHMNLKVINLCIGFLSNDQNHKCISSDVNVKFHVYTILNMYRKFP